MNYVYKKSACDQGGATNERVRHLSVQDQLGRAYNRTTFMQARVVMMQRWADYLDELRALPSNVLPLAA